MGHGKMQKKLKSFSFIFLAYSCHSNKTLQNLVNPSLKAENIYPWEDASIIVEEMNITAELQENNKDNQKH